MLVISAIKSFFLLHIDFNCIRLWLSVKSPLVIALIVEFDQLFECFVHVFVEATLAQGLLGVHVLEQVFLGEAKSLVLSEDAGKRVGVVVEDVEGGGRVGRLGVMAKDAGWMGS